MEDPLRVLRGMQFAARFDLTPAPETVALCRSIVGTFPELAVVQFGTLLDEAFEAQLEGGFTDLDGALKWLDNRSRE